MLRVIESRRRFFLCILLLLPFASPLAQTNKPYPVRPIRLIVPFAPGGSTDALARIVGAKLSENIGEQVVVDNRPGAGGNIAVGMAARATPDGYVLVIVASGFVVNPSLYTQVPYDPIRDFAPISFIANVPTMMVAHPSVPAKNVKELIALSKSAPGKLNYGSPGYGSHQHLGAELFKLHAAIDLTHVPFNGAGPAAVAVLGRQVQLAFVTVPTALAHVEAGRLRALAITSDKRSPVAADVPTFIESGFPGLEADQLQGILAPAGTPKAVIARLNAEIVKIVNAADVRKRLLDLGFIPVGSTPEEFAEVIRFQIGKWGKIVKEAGIRAE